MSTRVLQSAATAPRSGATDPARGAPTDTATLRLPWLERWHLLSLDAPTVATLWTWFLAHSFHAYVRGWTLVAMFLAVWILYAGDRLLDARRGIETELEERHYFHIRHEGRFLAAILLATPLLALALNDMPHTMLCAYVAMSLLLAAWLGVIHTSARPARLPKELAVGLFFAAAVALPTLAHSPAKLPVIAVMLCLALMVSANCLFLLHWETPMPNRAFRASRLQRQMHPTSALGIRHARPLLLGSLALCAAILLLLPGSHAPASGCALSLLLLCGLDRLRPRLAPTTLRAFADAALLTPLLLLLLHLGSRALVHHA